MENHLTNLAARWRKKMEKMNTMASIITTNGSLYVSINGKIQYMFRGRVVSWHGYECQSTRRRGSRRLPHQRRLLDPSPLPSRRPRSRSRFRLWFSPVQSGSILAFGQSVVSPRTAHPHPHLIPSHSRPMYYLPFLPFSSPMRNKKCRLLSCVPVCS